MIQVVSRIGVVLAVALAVGHGAPVSAQRAPTAQQLAFAPYRASGIYEVVADYAAA